MEVIPAPSNPIMEILFSFLVIILPILGKEGNQLFSPPFFSAEPNKAAPGLESFFLAMNANIALKVFFSLPCS